MNAHGESPAGADVPAPQPAQARPAGSRAASAERASDAERERIATVINAGVGDGRLDLAEAEERLNLVYDTKFRHELSTLVADLPGDRRTAWPRQAPSSVRRSRALPVHAGLVAVLSVLLITRWVASGVPFFWPAGPMFFLLVSLVVHAGVSRRAGHYGPPSRGVAWGRPTSNG